ncbi:MAG TPA: HAMP domain-containing sensor histidine kinase [Planctomycetota bacterium]|nr:HAMP domain-containing sensor histidine kinase [Planctomycetota bacterium]
MSLAWRILLLALAINAVTVGTVQVVVHSAQQSWFANASKELKEGVQGSFTELERVYTPKAVSDAAAPAADATQVRKLLMHPTMREMYEDVIVTSGRPPYDTVYLNPHGAVHRDPDLFPHDLIVAGMVQARGVDDVLPVAGGFCYALRQDGAVVGHLWFLPKVRPVLPKSLPLWTSVLGVAAATLLFGVVLFWAVRRTIRRPLQALGEAAAAVGRGRYDVRLPERQGLMELAPVVSTFNRMAAQVEDYTKTLERAVQDAVEQTKQKERALVLSARLASMGTLAAGVAHEINNPIGGMQNAVNRLLQVPGLTDKQIVYLKLVQDGLQRIARTTSRLLDFSPRNVTASRFSLATAIEGARALVDHRLQKQHVSLDVDLAPGLPSVHGDAYEIQQVMLNLLLNSLDAMQKRANGRVEVRAYRLSDKVHLHVDDDGPGMDPQDLPRVFDPFFSKKDRPDASGLGMFISYSIVRNHGGDITVDSRLGEGFKVHIVLPAVA